MITTEELKTLKSKVEQYKIDKPKNKYIEIDGLLYMCDLLIKHSQENDN